MRSRSRIRSRCRSPKPSIGPDFFCTFYNTNTQWPHSGIQHVHRDFDHLFPGFPVALPIIQVIVNIPLTDFTLENGATEVWPGSHLIVDEIPNDNEAFEERAKTLPSVRTTVFGRARSSCGTCAPGIAACPTGPTRFEPCWP